MKRIYTAALVIGLATLTGCATSSSASEVEIATANCVAFAMEGSADADITNAERLDISETVCARLLDEKGADAFIEQWSDK